MKGFAAFLLLVIIAMQYRLWFGEGSLSHHVQLKREIEKQRQENALLKESNKTLAAQVTALKVGSDAIEARARQDMGMIKKGETFFMIIDETLDKN